MAESAPSAEVRLRYEMLKKEILNALPKKRAIDKQLVREHLSLTYLLWTIWLSQVQIEAQIHNLEATYLSETAQHSGGNIIHGFEGYLKNQTIGRRKYEINDQDRIFSNSSLTVAKVGIIRSCFCGCKAEGTSPWKWLVKTTKSPMKSMLNSRPRDSQPWSSHLQLETKNSLSVPNKNGCEIRNINERDGRIQVCGVQVKVKKRWWTQAPHEGRARGRRWRRMINNEKRSVYVYQNFSDCE